jgi:diaminopimelate decarboxylase
MTLVTDATVPLMAPGTIAEAIDRFGTPLYLYDERRLIETLERIERAVVHPETHFHYAMVANRAWGVLATVARKGWRFHFNSPMELEVARLALRRDGGFSAGEVDRIIAGSVFSGGSISAEQMRDVIRQGVFVHVTACDQLALFGTLAGERGDRSVGLRVQFDANMKRGRQGVVPDEIPRALRLAREHDLAITSVHMYRGTGTGDADTFAAPFGEFVEIARRFPELRSLDIGGGFGYDYRTRGATFDWTVLAGFVEGMMREVNGAFGRPIRLRLEIGRAAVAPAGIFATRVLSRKPGFAEGEVILGVDASSMSVKAAAPSVVGKRHHYLLQAARPGADRDEAYTLVGPTTYTSDYLAKRVTVAGGGAEGVQPGDVVLVLDCGAYGAVTHSEFLTTPRPAEAMLTAGGELVALARRTGVEQVTGCWA